MPYIEPFRRIEMDEDRPPENAGELNYCLTWHMLNTSLPDLEAAIDREIEAYLSVRAESYAVYNEVVGALECCRREFVRRRGSDFEREDTLNQVLGRLYADKIGPYEDTKIEQNGDVYP